MAEGFNFPGFVPPTTWPASAPATGTEALYGADANGNFAAMPLASLRYPGRFRCDPTTLTKWRRARGRVTAGTGALTPRRARILCLGDSTTAGIGAGDGSGAGTATATNAKKRSWPTRLGAALSAAGVPAIEQSFFGENQVYSQNGILPSSYDARLSFNPAFGGSGFSAQSSVPVAAGNLTIGGSWLLTNANGAALTFTPTIPVDTFVVFYGSNSATGTFNYSLDGGATTAVNANASTASVKTQTISAALGTHALTITNSSTNYTAVVGIMAYNSASPAADVINGGRSGGVAADGYPASSFNNPWNPLTLITQLAPDLTIINHGINEWRTSGYSLATFTSAMQAYIAAAQQTGDVMVIVPIPSQISGNFGSVPVAQQQKFQQAMYGLAQSNNLPLLDMTYVLGSGAMSSSLGLMADQLHGLDILYQDEAQEVANFLMAV